MKLILILFLSITIYADLLKKTDVIVDTNTNIIWQDNSKILQVPITHYEAQLYCSNLKLDGKQDWVLPTIYEFQTLINSASKKDEILPSVFSMGRDNVFWSDTTTHNVSTNAFSVFFEDFRIYQNDKNDLKNVRCIRYSKLKN